MTVKKINLHDTDGNSVKELENSLLEYQSTYIN